MSRAWCRWCGAEIRTWRTWKPAHAKPTNPTQEGVLDEHH